MPQFFISDRSQGGRRFTRVGLPWPTPAGWGLALMGMAILAAAFNTGNNLLYLLFSLMAATLPVSLLGSFLNLVRIHLDLKLPSPPQAGQPFPVHIRLKSCRRRPARSLRITLLTETGPLGEAVLERLPAGGNLDLVLPVRQARRGPVQIHGVRLTSSFPLGLLERRRFFHLAGEVLVLPRSVPAVTGEALSHRSGGTVQSPLVSGEEYRGLRQGRPEEDVRRVDWKSTARRGELMIRETSGEAPPWRVFNIVTRCAGEPLAARQDFEARLSRLCGQVASILLSDGAVRLLVDGGGEKIYQGSQGLKWCRIRLARLEPTGPEGHPLPWGPPCVPGQRRVVAPESGMLPGLRAHALSVRAALFISSMALFATGALGKVVSLALAGAFVTVLGRRRSLYKPRSETDVPVRNRPWGVIFWRLAGFLALAAYGVDLLFIRHNPLRASLDLVAFITIYKLFNSGGWRDDRQILLVSLLQMILTAALTTQVGFLLPLLAWIFAAAQAQLAWTCLGKKKSGTVFRWVEPGSSGWFRYPGLAAALTLLLMGVAGVLFVLVPHLGTGTFAPGALFPAAVSGFSRTARLGEIGRIKLNRSRVMEIQVGGRLPPEDEMRWRGLALSHFDGRVWSEVEGVDLQWLSADGQGRFFPTGELQVPLLTSPGGPQAGRMARRDETARLKHRAWQAHEGFVQHIRLEPQEGRVLFAAALPQRIESTDFLFLAQDPSGALLLPGEAGRRVAYTVVSRLQSQSPEQLRHAHGPDPPEVSRIDLQVPRLDPRLQDLSRRLTMDQPNRFDAALAIRDWLSHNLRYSLNVNDRGLKDPLAAFLLDGMPAHCEYFATSMVILARLAGIPSRFVAGYQRGEQNRISRRYSVRQSDAHAWVEVFFPGVGWVPFDPTPEAGQGHWQEQGLLGLAGDLYSSVARLWDDYVIGIDLMDQATLMEGLRENLAGQVAAVQERLAASTWLARRLRPVALLLFLLGLVWGGARLRKRRTLQRLFKDDPLTTSPPRFYLRLLLLLAKAGLIRGRGETAQEFAGRAAACLPLPAGGSVQEITHLYHLVRFDPGAPAEAASRHLARLALMDLRRALRNLRRSSLSPHPGAPSGAAP